MNLKFLIVLLILILPLCTCSYVHYLPNTLASETEWSQYPYAKYVVSIQTTQPRSHFFGYNHICVGTIIAPVYVLTASHCVFDKFNQSRLLLPEEIVIVAGSPNRLRPTENTQIFGITKVQPFFRHYISARHDLALLRLGEMMELNLTRSLGIAKLPLQPPPRHGICSVLGWGRPHHQMDAQFAELLMQRSFRLQPMRSCHSIFPVTFGQGMICAIVAPEAKQDACRGDSGGPLFCGDQLTGIVSRGVYCDRQYPIIFISVFFHRRWIKQILSSAIRLTPQIFAIVAIYLSSKIE